MSNTEYKIKEYLEYFHRLNYPALFDGEVKRRLDNVSCCFGDYESSETILETRLDVDEKNCDYSIKVSASGQVREYWYELDYDAYETENIIPCCFMDASYLKPGMDKPDMEVFIDSEVAEFAGKERTSGLKRQLLRLMEILEGHCRELYQLGVMNGRSQNDSIRVFPESMTKESILEVLSALNWNGDIEALKDLLTELEKHTLKKGFIIDFDIYKDHISDRIGINHDPLTHDEKKLREWLQFLVDRKWCTSEKSEEVIRWEYTPPQGYPFIINDYSHFKLQFMGNRVIASKVYLRQGSISYRQFNVLYRPLLMNLELTDRCPLHCPQCYCDLNHGRDMSLDTALYWIREAAENHVHTINLSGGETMLYPHLTELIEECKKLGLENNIAVSGWGLNKPRLTELIEAGVSGICVSLNGSTEAVNSKTRDGYELAVNTLKCLSEIGYKNTCINWVMHSYNAEDFPNIVKLAEDLNVSEIAVMVFKPDSSHQLPSAPSASQMRTLAKFIKTYDGPVSIDAEPCFSQMRALIRSGFFGNFNIGIQRGCGAGRDGVSVSLEGKLTPCRHLEFKEAYHSLGEYWEKSEILKKLREMETDMKEPCLGCQYRNNCLPCAAVNVKLHDRVAMGCRECPLA